MPLQGLNNFKEVLLSNTPLLYRVGMYRNLSTATLCIVPMKYSIQYLFYTEYLSFPKQKV